MQYLKGVVQCELSARGYQYNAQATDLLVKFNVRLLQEKVQVSPAPAAAAGQGGGAFFARYPFRAGQQEPISRKTGFAYE